MAGSSTCIARFAWGMALAVTGACAADADLDALIGAGFIHCAFFPQVPLADVPHGGPSEREADLLVHFAGIDRTRTRARSITTRSVGSREVAVVLTERAVHFVEPVAGAFRVTTVTGCNERSRRAGPRTCVSYGAATALHFDASVLWQPDAVFDRIRHMASHGFCDHSFRGVQP